MLMSCTKIGKGSSADVGVGRQTVTEVKFIIPANPTVIFATILLSRTWSFLSVTVTITSMSTKAVHFSIVL